MKWIVKALIIFVLGLSLSVSHAAGIQDDIWNKTFGGHYDDGGWFLQQTTDGGYVIVGHTCVGKGSDLWVLKLNSSGDEEWSRILGGSGEDLGYAITQTDDGYIITGSTNSYGVGEERLWIVKLSSQGSVLWDQTYGGFVTSAGDGGWCIDKAVGGGYLIGGYTRSSGEGGKDLCILKVDDTGKKVWSKAFGGRGEEVAFSLIPLANGGVLASGYTTSFGYGGEDVYLVKLDSNGNEVWNETYGDSMDEVAFFMIKANDGGYVLCGRADSTDGDKDVLLMKLDPYGSVEWSQIYDLPFDQAGMSLAMTADGGYLICGRTFNGMDLDIVLMKTDTIGNLEWQKVIGGYGNDIGTSVVCTENECMILAITDSFGHGAEDVWLIDLPLNTVRKSFDEDQISSDNTTKATSRIINSGTPLGQKTISKGDTARLDTQPKNGSSKWPEGQSNSPEGPSGFQRRLDQFKSNFKY